MALLIVAAVTALRAFGSVDSDVSWQLWIARHIHEGAHLYRDIVETNPPLWFWMAIPVDALATVLRLRVGLVLISVVGGLCALSIFATDRLLDDIAPRSRTLLLSYAALILAAMPWMHVGQREQIALIGSVPYAALIAARRSGRPTPRLLAAAVGAGAAPGFALKHYFLLVPALLELWLAVSDRKAWRLLRPETIAIVAVGACYALAVLIWGYDFLLLALPLLRLAYGATGAPRLIDLFQPPVIVGLLTSGVVVAQLAKAESRHSHLPTALLVAAAGFAAAYFIQAKGWIYHTLPLLGCSALASAALIAVSKRRSPLLIVAAPALLLMPFALSAQEVMREPQPTPDLLRAVDGLQRGENVGFIATDPSLGWVLTLQRGLRYASRYNGFWMLRAVVRNEALAAPDPRLREFGRRVVSQTVADFRCIPPRRIIIARPRAGEDGFDILPFFLRDPRFADLLAHYRPMERTTLDVYELARPLPPVRRAACRKGV